MISRLRSRYSRDRLPDRPGPAVGEPETPLRHPIACGALGAFDRDRVERIAAGMALGMRAVHEAPDCIVFCDREPQRWSAGDASGLAWTGPLPPPCRPRTWQEAGRVWNAPGLHLGPEGPLLHTSISGSSPLYLQAETEASYFASAVDPLVCASPAGLGTDWSAWASIMTLGLPVGGRTPFEEIRSLGPWCTVRHRPHARVLVEEHSWPWAAIEPVLDARQGAEAVVEALIEVFGRLEGLELTCPISAGRDSRLLLSLAHRCGAASLEACTVYEDTGTRAPIEMASAVCRRMEIPHKALENTPEEFWDDVRTHHLASDFQVGATPWLTSPLRRGLDGRSGLVLDGFAGNVLFEPTARSVVPEVITEPGTRWRALLWQKMRTRSLRAAFRQDEAAAIGALAREQFLTVCDQFQGHPARAALAFYVTRTLRAIALRPAASVGEVCATFSPLAEPPVAEALLAVRPEAKFDRRLYAEVFALLNAEIGDLPFSSEGAGGAAHGEVPRRRVSQPAMRGYRRIVGTGSLRPHLSGRLRGWLAGDALLPRGGRQSVNALEKPVVFHLWQRRYRRRLRESALADAFAVPPRSGNQR